MCLANLKNLKDLGFFCPEINGFPAGKVSHGFGQNGTIVTQMSQFQSQLYHFVWICVTIVPFDQIFPSGFLYFIFILEEKKACDKQITFLENLLNWVKSSCTIWAEKKTIRDTESHQKLS